MSDNQPSDKVRSIAEIIKSNSEVDEEQGLINVANGAYEETLPEDLTMDQVKKVYRHTEDVVAGLALANGELGENIVQNNTNVNTVSAEMKIPRHVEMHAQYNKKTTGPKSVQDRTPVDRYGTTQVRVKTLGQQPNRGEFKKVRSHLQERAEKLFS